MPSHKDDKPHSAPLGVTNPTWHPLGMTNLTWHLLGVTNPTWHLLGMTNPTWHPLGSSTSQQRGKCLLRGADPGPEGTRSPCLTQEG